MAATPGRNSRSSGALSVQGWSSLFLQTAETVMKKLSASAEMRTPQRLPGFLIAAEVESPPEGSKNRTLNVTWEREVHLHCGCWDESIQTKVQRRS